MHGIILVLVVITASAACGGHLSPTGGGKVAPIIYRKYSPREEGLALLLSELVDVIIRVRCDVTVLPLGAKPPVPMLLDCQRSHSTKLGFAFALSSLPPLAGHSTLPRLLIALAILSAVRWKDVVVCSPS